MNYLKKFKKDKDKTPDESTTRELSPEDVPNDDEKKKDAKAKDSMTDKAMTFMKPYLKQAQSWTANQASDAKLELQKAAGLGARPDVLPQGEALVVGEPRTVELGWHPVAGATGKWFAEKTIIGAKISQKIGKYPDPTQHWAVIVGDYVHQLWMVGFNQYQKLDHQKCKRLTRNTGRKSRHHIHQRTPQTRRLDLIRSRQDTLQRSSARRSQSDDDPQHVSSPSQHGLHPSTIPPQKSHKYIQASKTTRLQPYQQQLPKLRRRTPQSHPSRLRPRVRHHIRYLPACHWQRRHPRSVRREAGR